MVFPRSWLVKVILRKSRAQMLKYWLSFIDYCVCLFVTVQPTRRSEFEWEIVRVVSLTKLEKSSSYVSIHFKHRDGIVFVMH